MIQNSSRYAATGERVSRGARQACSGIAGQASVKRALESEHIHTYKLAIQAEQAGHLL